MTTATWPFLIGCLLLQVNFAHKNTVRKPTGDLFDALPSDIWRDISSPFTESYDDLIETELKTTPEPLPFFEDFTNSTNVTAQFGNSVYLPCKVNDLRDKTVSWVRRREEQLELITFGLHTYSSDSRYSLEYQHPNDWRLLIQFANERDEGQYECQVSAHPPLVYYVNLNVVVPHVDIVDERGGSTSPDKFYKAGSTIELKCVVSQVPQPSAHVTWKHGQRMLNYDTSRGGISVKTDKQPQGAISRLYVANANKNDSGNYTCSLADFASTTISVHVLEGENPAAMQHGGCGHHYSRISFTLTLLLCCILLLER